MGDHINRFLAELSQFRSGFAYRGQKNEKWELESSALRRLRQLDVAPYVLDSSRSQKKLLAYHRDELLDPARTAGFGIEDGRELTDLELLAKLQHFGAATGLLDFTWNPLVALWFACQPAEEEDVSGTIFAVNLNDQQQFRRVSYDRSKKKSRFEELLSAERTPTPLVWEPIINSEAKARIIGQSSVFVIGQPHIPAEVVNEIKIRASDKPAFRRHLGEHLGITDLTLFRDAYGFSSVNGPKSPIRRALLAETALNRGNRLHQQQDHEGAIDCYDQCLEQAGEIGEIYLLRANAKAALGRDAEACADYDRAKQCAQLVLDSATATSKREREFFRTLLFNRGNSRAMLRDFEGARADFEATKKHCPTEYWRVRSIFNIANVLARLHRLTDAAECYNDAIVSGGDGWEVPFGHAQFNLGNTFVMLGRLEDASQAFGKSANSSRPSDHAASNLESAQRVMDLIGQSKIESVSTFPESPTEGPITSVRIVTAEKAPKRSSVPFAGNAGSIGNTGGIDPLGLVHLPRGDGRPGESGFSVVVSGDGSSHQ